MIILYFHLQPQFKYELFHILHKIILDGEIKDAKMNSFSSDFQILIKH